MLTYLLGPLVGLELGPTTLALGMIECTVILIVIKPISDRLFFSH